MTQRVVGWVLTLAAVAGVVGAGLWADQGELAIAAALLVGGLGLFFVRTQLDGLVDIVSPLSRAGAVGLERSRAAVSYRLDMRTARAVALVALVGLAVVGLQLAPLVVLETDHGGTAAASSDDEWTLEDSYSAQQDYGIGNDLVVLGDYVYIPDEGSDHQNVYKVHKSNMSYTGENFAGHDDPNEGNYVRSMTTDGEYLYLSAAQSGTHKVDPETMTNVAEGGGSGSIAYEDGYIYQTASDGLRKLDSSDMSTVKTDGDLFNSGANELTVGPNGNIYVQTGNSLWKVSPDFSSTTEFASPEDVGGKYIDRGPDYLYVVNSSTDLKKIDYSLTTVEAQYAPSLRNMEGLHYSSDGYVYTAYEEGSYNYDTHRLDPETLNSQSLKSAGWKAFRSDDEGNLFSYADNKVKKTNPDTQAPGEPISGTVTDANGNPIEGASVEAVNTSTGSTADSGTTDSSGAVELTVDAGTYEVEATATDKETKTTTVDVPEGGTSVEFSLRDAPGSYTIVDAEGTEVTDRETRIELYEASPESITKEARYWLDETDKSPIATGSDSSISLDAADYDGYYVVAWRSEDGSGTQYRDVSAPVTNITEDWRLQLTGNKTTQQRVKIDDKTGGNWSSEQVTIRAEDIDSGETTSKTALGSENLGTLWLNDSESYRIYALRDDGAERHIGRLDVVSEKSDHPAVFDIRTPREEFNESDIQNRTDSEVPPWDNESDVSYPPSATVTADPLSPVAGDSITFDASSSTAFGGESISSYEWELPDGSTASGSTATWDSSGHSGSTATVTVTVTDSDGIEDTSRVTLYLAEDAASKAVPPSADAIVETDDPIVGEPVVLEEASTTADGVSIETVEWDVDGDGEYGESGDKLEFTPEEAGLRTVGLRVVDENGVEDEVKISFFVGTDSESGLGIGGGGVGGAGGGPIGGGGDGPTGAQQLALGAGAAGGYALWRRSGGPGVVALGRRAAPAVKRASSSALSAVGTLARGTGRVLRRLVGALT